MKSLKTFLVGLSSLVALSVCAAEGLVTLMVQGNNSNPVTNEVQIASQQQGTVKSYIDDWYLQNPAGEGLTRLRIIKDGKQIDLNQRNFDNMKLLSVTGPATIQLWSFSNVQGKAMATVDIAPAAYPPDRAVTVGPYSADMKVTMEMSTDLVNWTVAQNAAVYTNRPEARFFRIKLEKDIPAP